MGEVKGSAITARVRFVRDRWGEPTWRRLKDQLAPEHKALLEGRILPHAWAPYDLFIAMNVLIDRELGAGDLDLCREMGRYSAEVNLPTLYRIFYRLGSPAFILKKAVRLWGVHYTSGRLQVEEMIDGAKIRIEEFDDPHRAHCLSVLGWAERSVELSGGRVLESSELACRTWGDPACEMRTRWT